MRILILLLAILAPTLSQEVKCPTGWTGNQITGSCFLLVKESLDWETARRKCESIGNGAVLATIHTSQDNKFVKDILAKEASIPFAAWMGGTDFYTAGKWMWTDGTAVSCFTDWDKGQPSGIYDNKTEDCLAWWKGFSWNWNDVKCTAKLSSVCMIPVNKCGNGWTEDPVSRTCYKILDDKNDWEIAKKSCASLNAELASIRTYQEYMFVRDFLNPSDEQNFWLDGNVAKDGSWVWSSNGSPISLATYSKWSNGQPTFSRNENCLKLRRSNMDWFSANCGSKLSAVCKRYPTDSPTSRVTCKEGWTINPESGSCYTLVKKYTDWYTAKKNCLDIGGKLATIRTSQASEFIKDFLVTEMTTFPNGAWLGASDEATEGSFVWADGSPVTFTDWRKNHPATSPSYRQKFNCVAANRYGNYTWIDTKCSVSAYRSLCQIEA